MFRTFSRRASGALRPAALAVCAVLTANAARAEISAPDLWAHWQALSATGAVTLDARSARPAGGGIDLAGLRLTLPAAVTGTEADLTAEIERATLRPGPDGGAVLRVPADQVLRLSDGTAPPLRLRLSGSGLRMTARGDLPEPDYALASDAMTLTLEALPEGAAPLSGLPMSGALSIDALAGRLDGLGSGGPVRLEATLGTLTTQFAGQSPEDGTELSTSSAQQDLALAMRLLPPAEAGGAWSGAASLEGGPARSTSRQTAPGTGTVEMRSSAESARLRVAASPERLGYAGGATGLALTLDGDAFPVGQVEIAVNAAEAMLDLPLGSDGMAPQEDETPARSARVQLALDTVTAGDSLWSFFDPGGVLPRSAAHLRLTAESELVAVPEATRQALRGPDGVELPPFLPRSLRITEFDLRFAEAQMQAEGAFTTETAAGLALPDFTRPAGSLDVTVTGGLALLRRLTDGGLLAPEMAMGAQMMIGMFATQGAGDSLSSRIETEADGGVVVNGMRLR